MSSNSDSEVDDEDSLQYPAVSCIVVITLDSDQQAVLLGDGTASVHGVC